MRLEETNTLEEEIKQLFIQVHSKTVKGANSRIQPHILRNDMYDSILQILRRYKVVVGRLHQRSLCLNWQKNIFGRWRLGLQNGGYCEV
jgi:hypothetical protein